MRASFIYERFGELKLLAWKNLQRETHDPDEDEEYDPARELDYADYPDAGPSTSRLPFITVTEEDVQKAQVRMNLDGLLPPVRKRMLELLAIERYRREHPGHLRDYLT